MRSWREALTIGLLVLLAGCGGGGGGVDGAGGSDGGSGAPTTTTTSEGTTEPPMEPTGPESTRPTQQKPSIVIANAPIGGAPTGGGGKQCGEVNWLRKPLPGGTVISVGSVRLEPGGVFELDQSGCPADARPCTDVQWQGNDFTPCFVGVRQIANGQQGEVVALIMTASATCESQADCDSLAGDGGSQVGFTPEELAPSPATSSADG
jgi:hypothetical protein